MLNPWNIYKLLSSSNRVHFWSISLSCIVTILTVWIGFSYQYMVVDESTVQNRMLTQINFIKAYDEIGNAAHLDDSMLSGIVKYNNVVKLYHNSTMTETSAHQLRARLNSYLPNKELKFPTPK